MDKEFIMATAKEAERQILWSIDKWAYMSWGIRRKVATEYEGMATLALRVSGLRHKGWVYVSLNEGMDCYEVRLLNVARTKVKRTLEEVYCDNLGEVLDGLIEKDPTLPDDKYRDKAMRESARKMGMKVIDSQKKSSDNNSSTINNQNNSEDEVMTNETMKVADLIGKSVCNGNAKYIIKSVDGDKVKVDFAMGDNAAKEMNMKAEQIEKLLQGGWTIGEGTAQEPTEKKADGGSQKAEEPKAKTVKMTSEREQSGTRSGSAERESSRQQGKMETEPKQEQPKGKLTYSTYTNKKGKTCAKVSGFAETDAAYQTDAAVSLHGSATYENTKQGRVNFLLFGPRYAEVAKTVCQMLNEGKTVADCQAVVDAATEERAQKREEWKQKREAYRQEREGRNHQPSSGKVYTEAEMLDLMERVMRGDADALAEVNAIKAKAA